MSKVSLETRHKKISIGIAVSGPISYKIHVYICSSGTSAWDVVYKSPQVTADSNHTKVSQDKGLDRIGLESS